MNDTILIFIAVIGGGAGLAIVGVALWIMRQDDQAAKNKIVNGASAELVDLPAAETATGGGEPVSPGVLEPASELAPAETTAAPQLADGQAPAGPPARTFNLPDALNRAVPNDSAPADDGQEVLRLLRTPDGALMVAVNGRRYRSRKDITDAPTEQQIVNASQDLQAFLGAAPAQPHLPPMPAPAKAAEPGEVRGVVKVTLEEAAQMEMKPPSMDIVRQWRYVRDQQRKPQVQIKTVMDEIDEILQVMLIGTPLAGRGLKATDGAHGAVFILDGHPYDSVDELPDPQARDLIRSAIQKWDQKR